MSVDLPEPLGPQSTKGLGRGGVGGGLEIELADRVLYIGCAEIFSQVLNHLHLTVDDNITYIL